MNFFFILLFLIFLIIKSAIADEKTLSIKCKNLNNTTVLNFKINKKKNLYTTVYKKIKKRFIEIGEVVGQKNSSFILFEDKYAYLGVDFAWHYDKNTYRLRPVLLSEGTIKLKNLPEELSCVIISNN
jgi:hypothetical protein|tara:strand:+ start:481 stop:861 length:381 start_codon:yes stop_codon:yes gene_type:complete